MCALRETSLEVGTLLRSPKAKPMTDPTPLSTLLGELDALVAKMTPGPWHCDDPNTHLIYAGDLPVAEIDTTVLTQYSGDEPFYDDENAQGIVALVNAYKPLREGIERLEQLRVVVEDFGSSGCLTGDCPHETQMQCNAANAAEFRDMLDEMRAVLATEGDNTHG